MMMGLHPEMTYRVRTTNPLRPTHGSPLGVTQYWQVTEAALTGERIEAKLAATTFARSSKRTTVRSC
jgi:hypothetical protein